MIQCIICEDWYHGRVGKSLEKCDILLSKLEFDVKKINVNETFLLCL